MGSDLYWRSILEYVEWYTRLCLNSKYLNIAIYWYVWFSVLQFYLTLPQWVSVIHEAHCKHSTCTSWCHGSWSLRCFKLENMINLWRKVIWPICKNWLSCYNCNYHRNTHLKRKKYVKCTNYEPWTYTCLVVLIYPCFPHYTHVKFQTASKTWRQGWDQ